MTLKECFQSKSVANFLNCLGIFFMPYDVLPVMPTHYRPISVYFFFLATILYLWERRGVVATNKESYSLILFVIYSLFFGVVTSFYFQNPMSNVVDFFAALAMGIFCYTSMIFFCKKQESPSQAMDKISCLITNAYKLPIIICILEFLSLFTPFPLFVKETLNSITGGYHPLRICGSSGEPAWMSLHLLLAMPFFLYRIKVFEEHKLKVFVWMGVFSFVSCLSLNGFMILFLALFIYFFWNAWRRKKIITAIIQFVFLAAFTLYSFYLLQYVASLMPSSYFTTRILNLTTDMSLHKFLMLDGSVFVRIGFPLLALYNFLDYPILGCGAGSFAYMFKDYLLEYFPDALSFKEVYEYFASGTSAYATIYAKLLSEFGLIGAFLFVRFYWQMCKNSVLFNNRYLHFYACILIALPFQQGSYAYVPMWVGLAVFSLNKTK